jgi:hypothetical protein
MYAMFMNLQLATISAQMGTILLGLSFRENKLFYFNPLCRVSGVSAAARLGFFCVFICLSACVPNKMYRVDNIEPRAHHTMTYVEFDDQGDMWSENQLTRILDEIEKANQHPNGSVVFLFIHGWYHNAAQGDSNVEDFSSLLDDFARTVKEDEASDQPVIGVYIGWRGKAMIKPLNVFSFYTRAFATSRIAGSIATETILRISTTAKRNPNSKVILIGHSFGGQILERAITQSVVGAMLGQEVGEVSLPVDLAVLVNPAAKAVQTKQFIEVLARNRIKLYRTNTEGDRFEVPLIVSVTSAGDWATRVAFPAGVYFSSIFKRYRKYTETDCSPVTSQRAVYAHTGGHMRPLLSHIVTAEPLPEVIEKPGMLDTTTIRRRYDALTRQEIYMFDGEKHRFTIQKRPYAANNTPYWVIRVPRSLIPNHSAIFNFNSVRLLVAFFSMTGALRPGITGELVRESGIEATVMIALPTGGILFADRSRRVYGIEPGTELPMFISCLPRATRPADQIGLHIWQDRIWLVTSALQEGADDEFNTRIASGPLRAKNFTVDRGIQLPGSRRFVSSAIDGPANRVFLSAEQYGAIYVADLKSADQEPELLTRIGDAGVLSTLVFHRQTNSLLALDGAKGVLYQIDPSMDPVHVNTLTDGLGRPTSMEVDEARGVIYITNAQGRHLWALRCGPDLVCQTPQRFAEGVTVSAQAAMAVSPSGTLWLADLEARQIRELSPGGEIKRTFNRVTDN